MQSFLTIPILLFVALSQRTCTHQPATNVSSEKISVCTIDQKALESKHTLSEEDMHCVTAIWYPEEHLCTAPGMSFHADSMAGCAEGVRLQEER